MTATTAAYPSLPTSPRLRQPGSNHLKTENQDTYNRELDTSSGSKTSERSSEKRVTSTPRNHQSKTKPENQQQLRTVKTEKIQNTDKIETQRQETRLNQGHKIHQCNHTLCMAHTMRRRYAP